MLLGGMFYGVCQFSYLVLINDFVLYTTDMNNEDVALGITLLGKDRLLQHRVQH
mgnify:FL=1